MRGFAIVVSLIALAMPPHYFWLDVACLANCLFCIFVGADR